MVKIGVIGYGYVGKALADRLSNFYDVICYEKDGRKIVFSKDNPKLLLTNESDSLVECDIFIVTVQTPIDDKGNPDLKFIIESTELVAKYLSKGNIIVYESTVYPGVTEGICGKLIEKNAGLELNKDFYLGYSPERISPGDKNHTITNIAKIISASNSSALKIIKEVYSKVTQEIFVANSIMEAEAAKLLENLQRDVNIALMNEYLSVMQKLGINIRNVIDAANSKWNFNYYLPGFVGGHCIGIDTHYYIKVAQDVGITPKIAKISRMINEEAILNISNLIIEHVDKLKNKRICVLGITYKDNIRFDGILRITGIEYNNYIATRFSDSFADLNSIVSWHINIQYDDVGFASIIELAVKLLTIGVFAYYCVAVIFKAKVFKLI